MTKPSITLTLDRTIPDQPPIRVALTLTVWASREQADLEDVDIKKALETASAAIGAALFGEAVTPTKEQCADCRFWAQLFESAEEGLCRRHSPITKPRDDYGVRSVQWPCSRNTDWCGDFQRGQVAGLDE